MKTEKIEFEIEGIKHWVEMKRLSFGEKNQLEEEATDIKMTGAVPIIKISTSKLKEVSILKSVVDSSISLKTIEDIRNLPQEVGELLIEKVTELNSTDLKKNN
jgi:Zn-dependent M28 family amino/carboxypeptidase